MNTQTAQSQPKYRIIRPKDHDAWLEARLDGIGSSEAPAIAGMHFYGETPLKVYRRKKRLDPPKSPTSYMSAGHEFEDDVARHFARKTGAIIYSASAGDWIAVDRKKPWLRVSPDRLWWSAGTPEKDRTLANARLLECKTTSKMVDPDDLPMYWRVQVQYQMYVLGLKSATIAWISYGGGLSFGYAEVAFNPDFWAYLEETLTTFWKENVLKGVPPEDVFDNEDAALRWPTAREGSVTADENLVSQWARVMELKALEKSVKQEIEELQLKVRCAMRDADTLRDGAGNVLATWKNVSFAASFQEGLFKEEHPDLYAQYLGQPGTTRRLTFKSVKPPKSEKAAKQAA